MVFCLLSPGAAPGPPAAIAASAAANARLHCPTYLRCSMPCTPFSTASVCRSQHMSPAAMQKALTHSSCYWREAHQPCFLVAILQARHASLHPLQEAYSDANTAFSAEVPVPGTGTPLRIHALLPLLVELAEVLRDTHPLWCEASRTGTNTSQWTRRSAPQTCAHGTGEFSPSWVACSLAACACSSPDPLRSTCAPQQPAVSLRHQRALPGRVSNTTAAVAADVAVPGWPASHLESMHGLGLPCRRNQQHPFTARSRLPPRPFARSAGCFPACGSPWRIRSRSGSSGPSSAAAAQGRRKP